MKHIIAILALALFACGAPTDEDLELMQREQDVTAHEGWGVRSDVPAPNEGGLCSPSAPNTQACNYPSTRTISFRCIINGADGTLCNDLIQERVDTLTNQFGTSGWVFSKLGAGTPFCSIVKASLAGASGTGDIRPYVRVTPQNVSASLTEPAGGLPGTYRKFGSMECAIDKAAIDTNFAAGGDTVKFRVFSHALNHCFAACIGTGHSTTLTTRWHSTIIDTAALQSTLFDTRTACRIRAYSPSGSSISTTTGC